MTGTGWRLVFGLAAIFNFLVGAPLVFTPGEAVGLLGVTSAEPPVLVLAQLAGALIATIGIGYAMVAADPAGGRQVARMGAIGKIVAFGLGTGHYLGGSLPAEAFYAGCGDLAFAVLFMVFVLRRPVVAS